MKKALLLLPIILLAFGGYLVFGPSDEPAVERSDIVEPEQEQQAANSENTEATEVVVEPLKYSIDDVDSLWLVVNKQRPISLEYVPDNIREVNVTARQDKGLDERSMRDDAATALEAMFAAAEKEDIFLLLGSGYRDSDLQNTYYTSYVAAYGQAEADKFSAKPGTSEHQIGLVADVSPATQNCYLEECFASTPEGQWVRDNAHKSGFVIRYPKGKEAITGYQFEPWHLRYVGVELATELFEMNQTLEEYFELI